MTKHPLKDIVTLQKQGEAVGIYSCCSANEYVIEATGTIVERESKNQELLTGEIEVEVTSLTILNTSSGRCLTNNCVISHLTFLSKK